MEWAKTRPPARFDLAGSNIQACRIDDIPGVRDAIAFDGNNENGYEPLLEAIASRYGVETTAGHDRAGCVGCEFSCVCGARSNPATTCWWKHPVTIRCSALPDCSARVSISSSATSTTGSRSMPTVWQRALTPRTRLIIVTNPHNPSGVLADSEALDEIGQVARAHGAHVLVDEVYLDVAQASASGPGVEADRTFAHHGDAFVCTNSLTKSYGLSGLRCGWILSSPEVAERIRRTRDVVDGTGSIVSERLAVVAFDHLERLLTRATSLVETNRPIIQHFLDTRADLAWAPSSGTVVFPRLRQVNDSLSFAERLLQERETAVVPGRFFQAPAHIRIGFGGPPETLRNGLHALGAALDGLGRG